MALDPSIALQTQTPQIDLGAIYGAAMQLRQMHDQLQTQNALKAIAQQPGAIDEKTGSLTPNALAQIMKISPAEGMKAAAASGEAEQRAASAAHTASETQTVQTKQYRDEISDGLREYDAALASGNTAPDIAERQFRQGLVDQVGALSLPQADRDRLTKLATETPLPQLRAYAMTQEAADAQKKLTDERGPPLIINGNPGTADKAGNFYDAAGNKIVPETVERPAAAYNPQAAEERAKLGAENIKPEVLTDKDGTNYLAYLGPKGTVPSYTTLQGRPYTPTSAARMASGGSGGEAFTPEMGGLMAALAESGVSLPAGLRSKSQQVELYKGILERNPGKTPDEIANLIKTGQIEFGAQKKETQTAAGQAGKVEVAQNELKEFIPLVEEASKKVPRTSFVPMNKLLNMTESQIGDPNLKQLKVYVTSVLNAYDALAARGGTDAKKREEAHSLITTADSPEALESALKAFSNEADAAHTAAVKATRVPELEQNKGGGPARKPTAGELASFAKVPPSRKEEARKAAQAAGIDISDLK